MAHWFVAGLSRAAFLGTQPSPQVAAGRLHHNARVECMDWDANEVARRHSDRRRLWHDALHGLDLAGKSVLDAGTGEGHCTSFLVDRKPSRLVSITCLEREVADAKRRLGARAAAVDFRIADLTAMPQIPAASFDVVFADFLIAAVAGQRPFREVDCLKELERVLRPAGVIIVTGWELGADAHSAPAPSASAMGSRLFLELIRLREALHQLTGSIAFREHPAWWVADRLADIGLALKRNCTVPDIHRDLTWLVRQCRKLLADLAAPELHAAFQKRVAWLEAECQASRASAMAMEWGQLYAVIAHKIAREKIALVV